MKYLTNLTPREIVQKGYQSPYLTIFFTPKQKKRPHKKYATFVNYSMIISPPRDAGRLIITLPTLLLGIRNSQFTSGIDLIFLSAIVAGI